jgi:hypothetical protein
MAGYQMPATMFGCTGRANLGVKDYALSLSSDGDPGSFEKGSNYSFVAADDHILVTLRDVLAEGHCHSPTDGSYDARQCKMLASEGYNL